jgi:hypothetical protein
MQVQQQAQTAETAAADAAAGAAELDQQLAATKQEVRTLMDARDVLCLVNAIIIIMLPIKP